MIVIIALPVSFVNRFFEILCVIFEFLFILFIFYAFIHKIMNRNEYFHSYSFPYSLFSANEREDAEHYKVGGNYACACGSFHKIGGHQSHHKAEHGNSA